MAKNNPIACRFDDDLIEHIDSVKKPGEDRSSCIRRIIKDSINRTDNLEKTVELIVSKYIDKKSITDQLNGVINSCFIDLNKNLLTTLKMFSDNSLTVSNSVNDTNQKVNDIRNKIAEINERIDKFENSIGTISKDLDSIKSTINNFAVTE